MSNTTLFQKENQAWQEISCKFSEEITNNIELFFSSLCDQQRSLIKKFLSFSFGYKRMYFSIQWLAKQIGCGKTKLKEMLKFLKEQGIIVSLFRQGNTSLYKIAQDFYQAKVQSKLAHIFTILREVRNRLTVRLMNGARPRSNIKRYLDLKVYRKGRKYPLKKSIPEYVSILSSWDGISPTLNHKDYNSLSLEQKINLSAFPEFIVEEADFSRQGTYNLRNIAAYMFKVCFDKANKLGIVPNWGWVNKLKERYKKEIIMANYKKRYNPMKTVEEIIFNPSGIEDTRAGEYDAYTNPTEERKNMYASYNSFAYGNSNFKVNPQVFEKRNPDGISPRIETVRPPDRILSQQEKEIAREKWAPKNICLVIYSRECLKK